MLSKIKSSCQQLRQGKKSSDFLRTFSQCFVMLSKVKNQSEGLQAISLVTSLLIFVNEKNVFNEKNATSSQFFQDKTIILTELILLFCTNNQSLHPQMVSETLQQLSALIDSSTRLIQDKVIKHIISKIDSGLSIPWSQFNRGVTITSLCVAFRRHQFDEGNIRPYIDFVLELPSFQQIKIQTDIAQEGQMNHKQKALRQSYQKLLLHLLSKIQDLNEELKTKIYRNLGQKVFSKLLNPLILSEFLLNKFQENPAVQIQVLSSLFILVGKYGLQLDQFFEKLQDLIQNSHDGKSVYELPNSRRFFKLIESALRSSKVPFTVILKISQIILGQTFRQQSQFSFWALSFIVNLTKKHRQLLGSLQKMPEIILLRRHYSSKIRALVAELDTNLNKAEYLDISQFSGIKNSKIIQTKLQKFNKKLEQDETLSFKTPPNYQSL